jgi:hypothetical protein
VIGKVPAGSRVRYAGRQLRVSGYGSVVFGIGRDEKGPLRVQVQRPDGGSETATIAVTPRDWPTSGSTACRRRRSTRRRRLPSGSSANRRDRRARPR